MCQHAEHFGPPRLATTEAQLYPPLVGYVHNDYFEQARPRTGWAKIVADTVATVPDPRGGLWSRPDVAAVLIRRRRFAPTATIETIGFEVKKHDSVDLRGVHEALAHRRMVNRSYLVWNRSACTCDDSIYFESIASHCRLHGVGLIIMHDPDRHSTYRIVVEAVWGDVDGDVSDEFIESRFSDRDKTAILSGIRDIVRDLP